MATTEKERETRYICPHCRASIRRYGRITQGYLKCVNPECPEKGMIFVEDSPGFNLKKI